MTIPEWVIAAWKQRVYDQAEDVDPGNEHHWHSMAIGFALGLGFKPSEAEAIARQISNTPWG